MGNIAIKKLSMKIENTVVLDNISERIGNGEFYALLGPSGCGKSTLLKLIAGLTLPTGGSVEVNGKDIFSMSQKRMLEYHKGSGFVFQNSALLSNMTIYENLSLYYNYHTRKTEKEIYEIIKPFLDQVGFDDDLTSRPSMLSTGEKMMINIVRAIYHDPEYIYWDNPMSMLDNIGHKRIKQIIEGLKKKKKTMVLVTNDYDYAFSVADRVGIMYKGSILESGTPREIKNSRLKTTRELLAK